MLKFRGRIHKLPGANLRKVSVPGEMQRRSLQSDRLNRGSLFFGKRHGRYFGRC